MSETRTPGWIYVLASQSHPGIVKIGRTSRHTPGRMTEVDRSAYAAFGPWSEIWSRAVADCSHVEAAAHRMLANRRVKLNRLSAPAEYSPKVAVGNSPLRCAGCSLLS